MPELYRDSLHAALAELDAVKEQLSDARQVLTYISSPTVVEQPERYSDFGRCIGMAQDFFERYPKFGEARRGE